VSKATIYKDGKEATYDNNDPVARKKAHLEVWDMTSEDYDRVEKECEERNKEFAKKYPSLVGLMWVDNDMYYLIDGKRVEVGDRLEQIKKEMGESFKEVASETCTVKSIEDIDNPDAKGVELSKDDRVKILKNMVDNSKNE